MASEGLDDEEWDADLMDQLIQAEELAIASQAAHHRPLPPPPSHRPPPPPPCEISYSPPHELSQRTHETNSIPDYFDAFVQRGTGFPKEQEKKKLKKEVIRTSKQLNHVGRSRGTTGGGMNGCLDLKREKEKEEQLKEFHSRIETKDAEPHITKNKEPDRDEPVSSSSAPAIPVCQNANPSNKEPGSWTKSCCRSEKLFSLWSSDDHKGGRVLVVKLFKTCEEDFHVLFNYLNPPENDSNMALSDQQCPNRPIEFAKVSHLYFVFTKISNDLSRLEDLLEALIDLCNLKNVFIVHWSLRVLHKILSDSFSFSMEKGGKRENVTVEVPFSESNKSDTHGGGISASECLWFGTVSDMLKRGQVPSAQKLLNVKPPGFTGVPSHRIATSFSGASQVSLFERMCPIATKNNNADIRTEALSIMNLILLRHNTYLERDKFAGNLIFWTLAQLLRREAGFSAQNQAIHALYLLCNCPKVIVMISSCLKEDGKLACSKDNDNSVPTFQELNDILSGLAECVAFCGSATAEEMKLRRNAIVFLAFLGSLGKPGFEILLNHRLPKGANFLAIILLSLMSDLDLQALKSDKRPGIAGEQSSLLIREALILLNRLVSHPQYSVAVLQALTATRDMAGMTVDVANRLSQKSRISLQDNETKKQVRESEIVDLALIFKKRVFTFLGDNIS